MKKEIWLPILGLENLYEISNFGNIKSLIWHNNKCSFDYERILQLIIAKTGYHNFHYRGKNYRVHRLVAQAFIPNPDNKKFVNHINGIKTDNRVENLEWCTASENEIHSYKFLGKKSHMKGKLGCRNHFSKAVLQFDNVGNLIKEWDSMASIERALGYKNQNISLCCNLKIKQAYSFIWKFK